ncbi:MAG: TetR/AcrR family transcriptional regulator [Oleispira antarctica]|uniref:Transcriptional regulator, TetR family n=1 Tax=Oleispira antarctica RB-8 TaxID=698738 RepID=R4YQW0_OLEAN|nr:TetR/AcrR family transcriptional regulator [Oleispira antarctica]MBQ0792102.1 TetR/AcrR family transcriptional regulator [Oleispira antarctica]CCK74469.1 Transcriptional regulator, TetR family [Oleispira antarctica RB-8]|tara:strand:- start:446 stop:1054 length:609 start_codon:yes stop_codon:yes gene_type:complete
MTTKTKVSANIEPLSTRQQIIEYSADMLRANGFEGFSYLDISRHLSITKASVHHHFPKKVDLGLALCDWTQAWLEQGLSHIDAKASSNWNKLERYIRAALKHSLNEQKLCPISAFYSDLNKLPESIKERVKALDDYELDWVTRVMQSGIENNEFSENQDARALASLFIFSCKGALYHARLHGKDLFQQTMKQFEHLIKPSTL